MHKGKAVFAVGQKRKTVKFETIKELAEDFDTFTWAHWPAEVSCENVEFVKVSKKK
jgi:hypothetical protein